MLERYLDNVFSKVVEFIYDTVNDFYVFLLVTVNGTYVCGLRYVSEPKIK